MGLYPEFVAYRIKPLPTKIERLEHAILGMVGEIGEIADAYKKHWIYERPLDTVNMLEELGDLRFYIQMAINEDLTPSSIPLASRGSFFKNLMTLTQSVGHFQLDIETNQVEHQKLSLSRILCQFTSLCLQMGVTEEEVIQKNIEKLTKRYPTVYSNEAAIARADKLKP